MLLLLFNLNFCYCDIIIINIFKEKKGVGYFIYKLFPHYHTLFDIYGRDRATGANVGNADDDEDEIYESDNISVNLGDESINEPVMEDFFNGMSNTPHSNIVSQQADSTISCSTNRSMKRKQGQTI